MKNKAAAQASLRKLVIGALALGGVFFLCIALLLSWILKAPIGQDRPEITVTMPRTGGLFEGSAATYRGVEVGRVTKIELSDQTDGIDVTVRLDAGAEVPKESAAKVRSLSPVGEQYIDFRPESAGSPYLADGDRISATAEDLPVSIAKMVTGLQATLRQVDPDKVRTVLHEINVAFEGSSDDLQQLVDNTGVLLETVDTNLPTMERVLVNGRTVLKIVTDNRDTLLRFATTAARVGTWYVGWDPRVQVLLTQVPGDLVHFNTLVADFDRRLPDFLEVVNAFGLLLARHAPALKATLVAVPYGIGRFASVMRNGYMNVTANLNGQKTCDYGGQRRNPTHVDRKAANLDGHCGPNAPWRGANHAPPALPN